NEAGDGYNHVWAFKYQMDGKRHELGLGPLWDVSLAVARSRAAELRDTIRRGIDPAQERKDLKDERRAKLAAERKVMTFGQCWEAYFKIHRKDWSSRHAQQWESSIRDYVLPTLGKLNVAAIDTGDVVKALAPIWTDKAETASRVQGRIKTVLDF